MSEYIGVFILVFLATMLAIYLVPPTGKFAVQS